MRNWLAMTVLLTGVLASANGDYYTVHVRTPNATHPGQQG